MSDLTHLEIPGHITLAEGNGGLTKLLIETGWSTAEIYLHGAHVTHFQKKGEEPLLFMSEAGEFDSEKPIRGGVPVIFPWFGPREELPSHGLARTVEWEVMETLLLESGAVSLRFRLPAVEFYQVELLVTVAATLSLELMVKNNSDRDATFENCLHTYFRVSSIDAISITGLAGTSYLDKITGATFETETSAPIRIDREVDCVYLDTSSTVEIKDPGFGRTIRIAKTGSHSTVVWNPWIEKSKRLADFGDDEYLRMVCVESGNIAKNQIYLPPGQLSVLKVDLSSE